jgi:Na+/H+ antiporter NhaD/arsenite permease-like protein
MMKKWLFTLSLLTVPGLAWAEGGHAAAAAGSMTGTLWGIAALVLFVTAYALVPLENTIHLRKSKPVLFAAGVVWVLVAVAYARSGDTHRAHAALQQSLLEYAELFLFLLAAMTYINAMEERNVFQTLRAFLVSRGFSLQKIFWITGLLAFAISPIADNLTTALLMGAVVMAVGGQNKRFITIACVNIVVAANAGGAFSPFGDITTLMVWQAGKVSFGQFFAIFLPSLVNWLIPAACMSMAIGKASPEKLDEQIRMKYGAKIMMGLFLLTIATAVCFHNFLHLPPAAGMMLGLGYLGLFAYHVKRHEGRSSSYDRILGAKVDQPLRPLRTAPGKREATVAQFVETSPHAAFAIDRDHRITHWNRGMERLTGVPAAARIGTGEQWSPFYSKKRRILADLIVDEMPDEDYDRHYPGRHRVNPEMAATYDAADFFPTLGAEGLWLTFSAAPILDENGRNVGAVEVIREVEEKQREAEHFDLMKKIARAEWDTLLFFYGVILCVGGLSQFGYLALLSEIAYTGLGATIANTLVGVLSAVVDNIPVMFAVLTMDPAMPIGQWLLATLTAGVGGSLLAIGSAAGVALMGTARGTYTFGAHLKWTPVIALGYGASIICHLVLNAGLM